MFGVDFDFRCLETLAGIGNPAGVLKGYIVVSKIQLDERLPLPLTLQ